MDCILRVIDGPDKGQELPLALGAHIIGRGNKAALRLTPEDVSWEHAVITRDGDDYFVENLSALGTWVGDARITGRVKLRPRDKVRLSGDCVLRLESTAGGLISGRVGLAIALTLMIALLVAMVFFSDDIKGKQKLDWDNAFDKLEHWTTEQANVGKIDPEVPPLFRQAWRWVKAEDWEHSAANFTKLQIAIDKAEPRLHCLEKASHQSQDASLKAFLGTVAGQPGPTDADYAPAFAEFVRRYSTYAAAKQKEGDSTKLFGASRN